MCFEMQACHPSGEIMLHEHHLHSVSYALHALVGLFRFGNNVYTVRHQLTKDCELSDAFAAVGDPYPPLSTVVCRQKVALMQLRAAVNKEAYAEEVRHAFFHLCNVSQHSHCRFQSLSLTR